ncbi:SRPBCC family protein [Saccharopolyspora erythraea]|uniref:SRPBCC family protein n=1 Tax=Saccharopolyspora erythraea TaxID=1836 RepID=UPI001BAA1797|nr:SRPBCC family protein [Saccharopolyspora erythraea]QUH04379.1 SRPBCC family protein [Saccharopolyspora erythraea]
MAQNQHSVSSSVVVEAKPEDVFALLADPRKHPLIDGSGTVREGISGPDRLVLGSKFGMQMKLGVGYRVSNTVVEYEENRRIAWKHFAPHRWRYELEPVGESGTKVTETFDYSRMPLPGVVGRTPMPANSLKSIEKTLQRLKSHLENGDAG